MNIDGKLGPIRKGLLEFLILKIIAADKVYVADMLKRLSDTEFATQEGKLYPLLSRMRRESLVDYESFPWSTRRGVRMDGSGCGSAVGVGVHDRAGGAGLRSLS